MKISSTDGYLELLPTGRDDTDPSVRLDVMVSSYGFEGQSYGYFDADACGNFLAELEKLEADRSGRARIESMSPGEVILEFYTVDMVGHLAIRGQIRRRVHAASVTAVNQLSFTLEIDPSSLPGALEEFRELLSL